MVVDITRRWRVDKVGGRGFENKGRRPRQRKRDNEGRGIMKQRNNQSFTRLL